MRDEPNRLYALLNAGRHAELESRARWLLDRQPDSGFAWKMLGVALMVQGKDALPALQRASQCLPDDVELYNYLGIALTNRGLFAEAEAKLRRALELRPDYAEAHYNLSIPLMSQNRMADAEASLRRALELQPDYAKAHYTLCMPLTALGRLPEAEASLRRALEIKPDFTEAHFSLGRILKEQGLLPEAETSLRRVLQAEPENIDALLVMGNTLMELGRFVEAEASFRRVLEFDSNSLGARMGLVGIKKVTANDENLAALLAVEESERHKAQLSEEQAMRLHFALGKSYDDLGEHEKSFPHFLEACRLKRATFDYDADLNTRHFDSIRAVFDRETLERLRGAGDPSKVPIFVLGMPRSGTTLTEQIVASHPEVHGAGELPDLMAIAQRDIAGKTFPDNVSSLDPAQLASWGADYVAGLQRRAPEARRITDKMPANFFAVGLIHPMLPNAKIIHVKRDPVDNCVSCFTQLFRMRHDYSYDLAELGRYYADYARLMEHWRAVLPEGAFLEVQYEDIVADQEAQARRIVGYCGLEWDDACLDFHKHKRAVRTASATQVRQPIYRTSVQRWKPYEKFLDPLLEALGELAPGR